MKKIYLLIILTICTAAARAQNKINWLTLEEAYKQNQIKPKKTIIDVYTGWCGWCKVMDKNTFTNPAVIDYVNKTYYAVKLDAESTKDIKIGTQVYKYDAPNKSNQAAIALLGGKMSYPSIVYLDEKFSMIQPMPGYQDAKAFHQIITYIGGDFHKKEKFETYKSKTYQVKYKGTKI
jgi:thioredoxin-related protein